MGRWSLQFSEMYFNFIFTQDPPVHQRITSAVNNIIDREFAKDENGLNWFNFINWNDWICCPWLFHVHQLWTSLFKSKLFSSGQHWALILTLKLISLSAIESSCSLFLFYIYCDSRAYSSAHGQWWSSYVQVHNRNNNLHLATGI